MDKPVFSPSQLNYLRLLAKQYPTVRAASHEAIRLEAILNLPKGTEHFMSDIHGEHEAFLHILNSSSGEVREKLKECFGESLSREERRNLATLIYYPKDKLKMVAAETEDLELWYWDTLHRMVRFCHYVSGKHTRRKVRAYIPKGYEGLVDELLTLPAGAVRHHHQHRHPSGPGSGGDHGAEPGDQEYDLRLSAHRGGYFRPGPPGGYRYGFSDGLPRCGYPVGQP